MEGNNHLIAQDFSMLDLLLSVSHKLFLTFCEMFSIDAIYCQTKSSKH